MSKHSDILMEVPKVISNKDLKRLRTLFDKTETAVTTLRSMGAPMSSYSIVLTKVIKSKLPQDLRLLISKKLSNEWDLDGLLKHVGEEINVRDKCTMAPIASGSPSRIQTRPTWSFRKAATTIQPTASTVMVGHERQASSASNVPTCLFC